MKRSILVTVTALAFATSGFGSAAFACGSKCGPPSKHKHVNAGVGNGAEFGRTEKKDRDPGNSGAHNQAGKNSFKPNSPRSAGGR
jgi:hypothetical protein